ncbi:MAG: sensor histidine kinase response regulator [Holophagaceae bacterium]|nr:sensor histidine kinase response regulator [Holophagaceae bacterium]
MQTSTLRAVIDSVHAPVFAVDRQYRYIIFNREHAASMKALYGVEIDVGQSLLECMSVPEDRRTAQANLDRALRGERFTEESYSGEGLRSRQYFQVSHSPIRSEQEEIVGVAMVAQEITKRKRAEEVLRESEVMYRSLVNAMAEGVMLQGVDGVITAINPAAMRIEGRSSADLLGRRTVDLTWDAVRADGTRFPGDCHPAMITLRTGEPQRDVVMGLRRPDGSQAWISINSEPLVAEAGTSPFGVVTTFHDITDQRRMEAALHERVRHSQSLLRLSRRLERAQTYHEVLKSAQDEVRDILGYQNLWVYLLSEDGKSFKSLSAEGTMSDTVMSEGGTATLWIEGDRMLEEIVRATGVVVVEDARTDPRVDPEIVARLDNRTLVNVPVMLSDRRMGSIGTGTFGAEGVRVPTPEEEDFLLALASHMAVVLDRIQLLDQRRQQEALLHRLNRELRAVSDCNQVLMRAENEQTLLDDICRIICEEAGYRMAWVGFSEADAGKTIRVVARAGEDSGYLEQAGITWADTERGRGPSGRALRNGETACIRDFATDPSAAPWRALASQRGYRSSISLPLKDEGSATFGVLTIYSSEADAFTPEETRLLEELAGDLAFGIMVLRARIKRHEAEAALREASSYSRNLIETSLDPLVTIDIDGTITDVNRATEQVTGVNRRTLIGSDFADYFTDPDMARAGYRKVFTDGFVIDYPLAIRNVSGAVFDVLYNASVYRNEGGEVLGVFAAARDITKRKQAEMEREQFHKFFITSADLMCIADASGTFVKTNPSCRETLGYTEAEFLSRPFVDFVLPEDRQRTLEEVARQQARGTSLDFENRYLCKDGSVKWLSWRAIYDREEGLTYAAARDITEHRRAEEEVKAREQEFRSLAENSPDDILRFDREGRLIYANHQSRPPAGAPPVEASPGGFPGIDPEERERFFATLRRVIDSGEVADLETRVPGAAGTVQTRSIRFTAERDRDGQVVGALAFGRDITEKARLEEQLRQSQKMEAIGQLAGGVAHDFNNILTAIMGFSNLARMKMAHDDPLRPLIDQILASSDRAAHLTKGLLAFSRKQVIQPKPADLNAIVKSVDRLLARLIGEDIELNTELTGESLILMVDVGQIEQVLMNLATNARDAMPKGGTLTISTEARELGADFVHAHGFGKAGRYAVVTVSDNGVGMSEAIREKIFDPFFTTKEQGKGTGLGLSIVYGIVKQHEGAINVYSEPGKGTTFRIYLPLVAIPVETERPEQGTPPQGGTETILLAEDDQGVRTLTTTYLREFGYRVIEAVDGRDAVETYTEHAGEIDLLILDVIMPKMSGKDAFDAIRAQHPEAKALFISGYTADALHRKGIFEEGIQFLAKPMSPFELLKKVRSLLDEGRNPLPARP